MNITDLRQLLSEVADTGDKSQANHANSRQAAVAELRAAVPAGHAFGRRGR